jgi:hypothetical protein
MRRKTSKVWIPLISLLLFIVDLQAQPHSRVAEDVAENNRLLRQYSWTMRAEALVKGEKGVGLFKMRYDLDGNIQSTSIGASEEEPPSPELLALAEAAFAYAQPRPNIMQAFINRAEIWEGPSATQGTVRIQGNGMMVVDDSVTWTIENGQARKLEVRTILEGEPIFLNADYRTIPNGATYVARLVAMQPAHSLELKIENFDYINNSPTPTRAPTPQAAPQPSKRVISVGTIVRVRLAQPLSTKKNKTGEEFEAILDQNLRVDGRTVIPRGSRMLGRLVEVKRSGRAKGRAKMVLTMTRLYNGNQVFPIETDRQTLEAKGTKGRDAKRIAGAAGLGALIGAIIDGKKGAARGAASGAGISGIAAAFTRGAEIELSAERQFTFELRLPVEVASNQ